MREPESRMLVPVPLLEDAPMPGATTQLVGAVPIVLLGYREVPDQTPPGQMRMQYEDEADAELDRFAEAFREQGAEVETRLVFTADLADTFTRVSNETACTSILLARPSERMESLLVPVRGDAHVDRLMTVTQRLLGQPELRLTLLHIVEPGEGDDAGQMLLEGARSRLEDAGIDRDRVRLHVQTAGEKLDALVEAASGHDAIVLGETEPSITQRVFGEVHKRVAERFDGPVVIVREELGGDAPDVPEA